MDNLRDQQFCTPLCELERLVVVLFTGIALEVEVPPGMVCFAFPLLRFYGSGSTTVAGVKLRFVIMTRFQADIEKFFQSGKKPIPLSTVCCNYQHR